MGCWSAGPGYPGKVDQSANNATRRERRSGKMTEALAGCPAACAGCDRLAAAPRVVVALGARPSLAPLACETIKQSLHDLLNAKLMFNDDQYYSIFKLTMIGVIPNHIG
jgi:hypothetical protein